MTFRFKDDRNKLAILYDVWVIEKGPVNTDKKMWVWYFKVKQNGRVAYIQNFTNIPFNKAWLRVRSDMNFFANMSLETEVNYAEDELKRKYMLSHNYAHICKSRPLKLLKLIW